MKAQLTQRLTPSISTFLICLHNYNAGRPPKNAIFNNFLSRIDPHVRSGKLYHAYKIFVKDCCLLAEKKGKRAFEVVNEITIEL